MVVLGYDLLGGWCDDECMKVVMLFGLGIVL